VVVDRTGEWLGGWDRPLSDYLRTPLTLHPGQSPGALIDFARQKSKCEAEEVTEHQVPTAPGFAPAPSVSLMHEFCKKKLINKLPVSVRSVIKGTVSRVQPYISDYKSNDNNNNNNNNNNENNNCGSDKDGETGFGLTDMYQVHIEGRESPLITRSVVITCSCTRPVTPKSFKTVNLKVDNRDKGSKMDHGVVIVGGGMDAALTALREFRDADASCGRVTLLARRPLRKAAFSCDVGWWGTKYLFQFWQESNPVARLQSCRLARPSASLTPHVFHKLAQAVAHSSGRFRVLEGVVGSTDDSDSAPPQCRGYITVKVTPSQILEDTKAPTEFQRHVSTLAPQSECVEESIPHEIHASKVLLCCGKAFDVAHHPLLSLLRPSPQTVGGYPVLDMNTCEWPRLPGVYVIGAGAMLAVGPAARELAGIRLAADRIVASIQRGLMNRKPKDIEASYQKGNDAEGQLDESKVHCVVENFLVKEAEGPRWAVKPPRPRVSQPPADRIDLEKEPSYSSSLPKKQVPKVSLMEDEDSPFEVSILLTIPEKVTQENVKTLFTQRSIDVWIIGKEAAYSLYVPRLYGAIVPKRCSVSVSKTRVTLRLFKERDIEWKFLKG
jgi:hypothetical protein